MRGLNGLWQDAIMGSPSGGRTLKVAGSIPLQAKQVWRWQILLKEKIAIPPYKVSKINHETIPKFELPSCTSYPYYCPYKLGLASKCGSAS